MLSTVGKVPSVVWLGKFATAFLMFGFAFLLLGAPAVPGLGITGAPAWLPGFDPEPSYLGIWLVYAGLVCSVTVFVYYLVRAYQMISAWRRDRA